MVTSADGDEDEENTWTKERCAQVFEEKTGLAVDVGPFKVEHVWDESEGRFRLDLVGAVRTANVLREPLALALQKKPEYFSLLAAVRELQRLEEKALHQADQLQKTLAELQWRLGRRPEIVGGQDMLISLAHQLRIHEQRERAFLSGKPGKPGRPQEISFEEGVRALRAIRGAKGKPLSERQIALVLVAVGALPEFEPAVLVRRVHDSLRASSRREKRKRRAGKNRP